MEYKYDDIQIVGDKKPSSIKGVYSDLLDERNKFYRTRVKKMLTVFAACTSAIMVIYIITLVTAVTLKEE